MAGRYEDTGFIKVGLPGNWLVLGQNSLLTLKQLAAGLTVKLPQASGLIGAASPLSMS